MTEPDIRRRVIWKYALPIQDDAIVLALPAGARVLTVQEQTGEMFLWALVDPTVKTEPRRFRVYGTGHIVAGSPGKYVGTAQTHLGALVWHVFEEAWA